MLLCNKWCLGIVTKPLEYNFFRSPNDWEEESLLNFLALLANTKVASVDVDKSILPHDSNGKFIVKSQ